MFSYIKSLELYINNILLLNIKIWNILEINSYIKN